MKSFKKLLAVVLSLAMVLGTLTVTALADEVTVGTTAALNELLNGEQTASTKTIKLSADITESTTKNGGATLTLVAGDNITLDLGGFTLKETSSRVGLSVPSGATLTIKNGTFRGYASVSTTLRNVLIENKGTLTIDDGATLTGGKNSVAAETTNAVTARGACIYNNAGTVVINEGATISSFTAAGTNSAGTYTYHAACGAAIFNAGAGNVTINGGTFSGNTAANGGAIYNYPSTATLTIKGGSFSGNTASKKGGDIFANNGAVNIEGGTFSGTFNFSDNVTQNITGGYFKNKVTPAEGYSCKALTTEEKAIYSGCNYKVVEGVAPKVAEVTIDGETQQYESYDEAIAAANAEGVTSSTVKLLADCVQTTSRTRIKSAKITLDLYGHSLTSSNMSSIDAARRIFELEGTGELTIQDTSAAHTGSITSNPNIEVGGAIVNFNNDNVKLYITGGNFYHTYSEKSKTAFYTTKKDAGQITGGWYNEGAKPGAQDTYCATGYGYAEVSEETKEATPYTVSNTFKTVKYYPNSASATGKVEDSVVYYKEGYTIATETYTKKCDFIWTGYSFMGWSTDQNADPDSKDLVPSGVLLDFSQYSGDKIEFYAIWKKVEKSMWVCIKTDDPEKGYADIAAALAAEEDVTLIKDITSSAKITASGTLNLNGYNILPTTTGSPIVVSGNVAVSIENHDAGTITIDDKEINFGGDGRIEGEAQGTGGAIEAGEGSTVKIYGGTFKGDAPTHGTVLTCSRTGMFLIYGGTFEPSNPDSQIDTFYANNSSIYVLGDIQSDVKMTGTFAKDTKGVVGIQGGWFSELQPVATIGTYNATMGTFTEDPEKALIANTDDANYPYSVGARPWYITYEHGAGSAPETANPSTVVKLDSTPIQLNDAIPAEHYEFVNWKDQDGNVLTELTGTAITKDLTLTAQYAPIEYTITYTGLEEGSTHENKSTYTIEDIVVLAPATNTDNKKFVSWMIEGVSTQGWAAGQTGDVTVTAVYTDIYTITYNLNCGEETTVSTDNVTTYTALDTVSLNPAQGTRKTYVFKEWVLVNDGVEGTEAVTGWAPGEKTGNLTIKAKWTTGAASVTIGESTIAYATFAEAGAAVKNSEEDATIKLLKKEVEISDRVSFGTNERSITLDLNGKTLTQTAGTTSGILYYGGALTITDTSKDQDGKMVDGTEKTLRSIVCQAKDATLTIDAGTFEGFKQSTSNGKSTEPGKGATITGGTFSFTPKDNVDTANYQIVKKDKAYTVYEAAAQVTVTEGETTTTTGYRYMRSTTKAQSALGNVVDGSTLTLLKNADASFEFGTAMTFTLDKNGYTYDLDAKLSGDAYHSISIVQDTENADLYTITVTETLEIVAYGGNVSDVLGMDVYISTSKTVIPDLTFNNGTKDVTVKAEAYDDTQGNATHVYHLTNIQIGYFAHDLAIKIGNTEAKAAEGITLYKSVDEYYKALMAKTTDETYTQELKNLLSDTAEFANQIQKFDSSKYTDEVDMTDYTTKTSATPSGTDKAVTVSAANPTTSKISNATLSVGSQVSIIFSVKASATDVADGKIKLNVTFDGGAATEIVVKGYMLDSTTGLYLVRMDKITPDLYGKTYTAQLYVGGVADHAVTYSVNSYCYSFKDSTEAAGDTTNQELALAVYRFGTSYAAYSK